MASTVTHVVTKTVASSATATSTSRAAAQAGILDHGDPSKYDPKNPIIIFIIQVCTSVRMVQPYSLNNHFRRPALSLYFVDYYIFPCPNYDNPESLPKSLEAFYSVRL